MRKRGDTAITKGDKVAIEVKRFISGHAQRILTNSREAIKNGTAPSWANALSAYPGKIPLDVIARRPDRLLPCGRRNRSTKNRFRHGPVRVDPSYDAAPGQ
jgi:hypothetical protein